MLVLALVSAKVKAMPAEGEATWSSDTRGPTCATMLQPDRGLGTAGLVGLNMYTLSPGELYTCQGAHGTER